MRHFHVKIISEVFFSHHVMLSDRAESSNQWYSYFERSQREEVINIIGTIKFRLQKEGRC